MKQKAETTPPVLASDPAEQARAEVNRLNGQELALAQQYRLRAVELADLRAKRGDEVLAATDPGAAARASSRRISEGVEELAALADAASAARRQRLAAIPAVFRAEADDVERQAEKLEADAAENEARVSDLLKAVEAAADWGYCPAEGKIEGTYFRHVPPSGGAFRIVDANGPRFARMRISADGLRHRAAELRHKQPVQAGSVEADSLEALFAVVHSDAFRIGPSIDAISAWYESAVVKERARRERVRSGDNRFIDVAAPITHLRLTWQNGAIGAASFVASPAPMPSVSIETGDDTALAGSGLEDQPEAVA